MIRIDYSIGKRIRDNLDLIYKKNKISIPDEIANLHYGQRAENFLEEEFDLIEELRIDRKTLDYLYLFKNLKSIILDLSDGLTQEELTLLLSKYPNLEKLTIDGQSKIQSINLSNNPNISELTITNNPDLIKIYGLDKLNDLYKLSFYNNYSYRHNKELVLNAIKLAKNIGIIELDVLLYKDVICTMDELGLDSYEKDMLLTSFKWKEDVGVYTVDSHITYNSREMKQIYTKAMEFIKTNIKDTDTDMEKFAIIYEWFCENVKYDDNKKSKINGNNGTYNSIVLNECVCQGYTKGIQFLLKLVGIYSFDIACICDDNKLRNNIKSVNGERRLSEGDHSIIKVNLDGKVYYSDVTWDADNYQKDRERRYFLLNKEDISTDHKLISEEETLSYEKSIEKSEFDRLMRLARIRLKRSETNCKRL